jgi:outer membrane receptor protein involved in Fe transport
LTTAGASALDVLNNVPSVNVDIEGQVSLRGSNGVQILINGNPSILTSDEGNALGTITAEMIDRIEVITNPSAKQDAEGSAGIINIVIKKDERKGVNGSISVNTGVPHNHSVGLSLNRRSEKFNLFTQIGAGYRELPRETENLNIDFDNNTTVFSEGTEYRNEIFYNLILGADYYFNPKTILTLSGNYAFEDESQPSLTRFRYSDLDTGEEIQWRRDEVTSAGNPKWQYEAIFKKNFDDQDENHSLQITALGNFFGKDLTSDFENTTLVGDTSFNPQLTETSFKEAKYTFRLDYTKPVSEKFIFETGGQFVSQDVSNDYAVFDLVNEELQPIEEFTNTFEFDQKVFAIYGTAAFESDKFGVKLGLRMETTILETYLADNDSLNEQNYSNPFPSAHISYKLNEKQSVQIGYSRRIYRPRLWDLNPFFNIRNNFNIRAGNPNLQPEFTDSYEITSIYEAGKLSLNYGLYYRFTREVIERVTIFEDNVSTTMPMNIGTDNTIGAELNAKYEPLTWLTFNLDLNYNYFQRRGSFDMTSFDFDSELWSGRLVSKVKLPANIDFELTSRYNSGFQTIQSEISDNFFIDMGLRKKLLKGKAVINLSVRDIFKGRFNERETIQPDFFNYSFSRRGRFVTLGFSYGFGKGEAMEYAGKR